MTYTPHTHADREAMLQRIGVRTIDDLFEPIPSAIRSRPLDLPPALMEAALLKHIDSLADTNTAPRSVISFLGGGAYQHHIPAAVSALASRGEFVTAYTPYQPEVSQGTLQVIYEWQSLMCELTGLDISNASLYDAATGCAEACAMAVNATGRSTLVVAGSINPDYLAVIQTYLATQDLTLRVIPTPTGRVEISDIQKFIDSDVAAILIQSPNFFGGIEDCREIFALAHESGALAISCVNPLTLALLSSPGELGADIATGDAQPFGISLHFGGPYAGFITAKGALMRRMPGRIAGASLDSHGNRAYVLTLQTREQHIKRDKATSNICSNHALCATIATIYLSHQGRQGLRDTAIQCVQKAHVAANEIAALPGYSIRFNNPYFHEFVVSCPAPAATIAARARKHGVLAGIPLASTGIDIENDDNALLVCATEVHSREDIDKLVSVLREVA